MDLLQITPEHIASKKVIGRLKHSKVFSIATTGGLNMIVVASSTPEILAASPHPAMSKWMAKKKEPDIEYNELSKSEDMDPAYFQHLVPTYEALTTRIQKLQKK